MEKQSFTGDNPFLMFQQFSRSVFVSLISYTAKQVRLLSEEEIDDEIEHRLLQLGPLSEQEFLDEVGGEFGSNPSLASLE